MKTIILALLLLVPVTNPVRAEDQRCDESKYWIGPGPVVEKAVEVKEVTGEPIGNVKEFIVYLDEVKFE